MAIGRVERGVIHHGDSIALLRFESDKPVQRGRVSKLYGYEGLERIEIKEASAGEIVLLAGFEDVDIGRRRPIPKRRKRCPVSAWKSRPSVSTSW